MASEEKLKKQRTQNTYYHLTTEEALNLYKILKEKWRLGFNSRLQAQRSRQNIKHRSCKEDRSEGEREINILLAHLPDAAKISNHSRVFSFYVI
jgi:hypothetical protein